MSLSYLHVLRTQIPDKYYCVSCSDIVCPDNGVQAPCEHLMCSDCFPVMTNCPDPEHSRVSFQSYNCKPIKGGPLDEAIRDVHVRCLNSCRGCKWIGTYGDYLAEHSMNCQFGRWSLHPSQEKDQSIGITTATAIKMVEKYVNAYLLWSWQGEMVDGQPVLSKIKTQAKSRCAFVSMASAFEANLRLKGHKVKLLSSEHLFDDYMREMIGQNAGVKSKLRRLGEILMRKGMVELSEDGTPVEPEMRWRISSFVMFDMTTSDGILVAVKHIRDHGPIVCVHTVTRYQQRNNKTAGVIHGVEDDLDRYADVWSDECKHTDGTHAVCTIGLGVEDLTSFLPYQNSSGTDVLDEGFGRMLPSSVIQAIGFFVEENIELPSKKVRRTRTHGHDTRW